jgi:hypothetical protein
MFNISIFEGKLNLDLFCFNNYPNFFPFKAFIHFWFFKTLIIKLFILVTVDYYLE